MFHFRMVKIYQKIHRFCDAISHFNTNRWYWKNDNVKALWQRLDSRDKDMFFFDMDKVNWNDYLKESMLGMRYYLMKDDPSTIPDAIKRMQK